MKKSWRSKGWLMITVMWKTAAGETGEVLLDVDDKWTCGRAGGVENLTVAIDNPAVSRTALVIRDSGPGPVVFRGQIDNGAKVALVSVIGSITWLDEGTAGNLTAEENRVELSINDEVLVTIDVEFEQRGSVVERQQAAGA